LGLAMVRETAGRKGAAHPHRVTIWSVFLLVHSRKVYHYLFLTIGSFSQELLYEVFYYWLILSRYCIARNRTWLYRLPQSQKTMYMFSKAYCYCMKHEKISSSAPGLGLMTHREYRVDRPFPVMWLGNVWEPFPPPPLQYRPEPNN
jgi:hypothetical protein